MKNRMFRRMQMFCCDSTRMLNSEKRIKVHIINIYNERERYEKIGYTIAQVILYIPNFVRSLVEKWAAEYQKANKQIDFQFKLGKSQNNELNIISFVTDGNDSVFFARLQYCQFSYQPRIWHRTRINFSHII